MTSTTYLTERCLIYLLMYLFNLSYIYTLFFCFHTFLFSFSHVLSNLLSLVLYPSYILSIKLNYYLLVIVNNNIDFFNVSIAAWQAQFLEIHSFISRYFILLLCLLPSTCNIQQCSSLLSITII